MLTKNIIFKKFKSNKDNKINQKIRKELKTLLTEDNAIIQSLGPGYRNNYKKDH